MSGVRLDSPDRNELNNEANMEAEMKSENKLGGSTLPGAILFVLYLVAGLMIFLFGNNWNSLFPTNTSTYYKWGLVLFFLVIVVLLRLYAPLRQYWGIAFSLFMAAFVNANMWLFGNWLGHLVSTPVSTAQELAIDKLSQAIPVVLGIIMLTFLSRADLGSIFLKRGDLKTGLRFGIISFVIFAVIFAVIAVLQTNAPSGTGLTAGGVSLSTIITAIPWILVFCFANSIMEELWLRGIILRKLHPFLGKTATILVTALVFGSIHVGATYISPVEMFIFPVIAIGLGLVNAHIMLKTDSIWGSVLFHAGYDLIVIIPILVSKA